MKTKEEIDAAAKNFNPKEYWEQKVNKKVEEIFNTDFKKLLKEEESVYINDTWYKVFKRFSKQIGELELINILDNKVNNKLSPKEEKILKDLIKVWLVTYRPDVLKEVINSELNWDYGFDLEQKQNFWKERAKESKEIKFSYPEEESYFNKYLSQVYAEESIFHDLIQVIKDAGFEPTTTNRNNIKVECADGTIITFTNNGYIRREAISSGRWKKGQPNWWILNPQDNGKVSKMTEQQMIDKVKKDPSFLKGKRKSEKPNE